MAKFLNRFQSTDALKIIILEAERQLILISPYVKLNSDLRNSLSTHLNKPELELIIVYGKNEEDKRKSISEEDYDFFKSFSTVSIRYHKRLHAKMYANDVQCLTTSMNLHNYSLRENIETGILTEFKLLDIARGLLSLVAPKIFSDSLDTQATDFVEYIVEKSTIEFERKAKKESSWLGLSSTYSEGDISVDKARTGYCIRTKEIIPLNPQRPYNKSSFDVWTKYGSNRHYEEKYCHQCGKANKSSMAKPNCYDCYKSK
jgi:hypothetical protein